MESGRMNTTLFLTLLVPLLLSPCLQCHGVEAGEDGKKVYIVYMGEKQYEDPELVTALHHGTLSSVLGSKDAALESLVYSYKHGFSGFSARLTNAQADQIAGLPGVLSVTESHPVRKTTTRSWDFLGLSFKNPPSQLLHKTRMGEDVIIGVVDTGVWPESKSFSDEGLGPIPSRWKGKCVAGVFFNTSHCNRKLIGARYYDKSVVLKKEEYRSARDTEGHGTHTASTAAGSLVRGVSFHGLAAGWARGGAPGARVAIYKVLWAGGGGDEATIMKAIDDAIHDGVDILSLSLGPTVPGSRPSTGETWATLYAVQKGITVIYSAGNDGPTPQTVLNPFPWVITVAASTMDRSFPTVITLGDKRTITGQATYYKTKPGEDEFQELYYDYSGCNNLNATQISGRIVICNTDKLALTKMNGPVDNVKAAGGAGVILTRYSTTAPQTYPDFPVAAVDLEGREQILQYVRRAESSNIVVKISPSRAVQSDSFDPRIAAFSSRGPSPIFPALLKPDVAAPGVRILAAVKDGYEFLEGTSMACPHVSGIVALLKSLHPNWSPAAIKSAIITTASIVDKNGLPIMAEGTPRKTADPFDYGGGNIDPEKAADPGLIYDINPRDYLNFKCIWDDTGKPCRRGQKDMYHLNLPSIAIPNLSSTIIVSRTVTNVGAGAAKRTIYNAIVEPPAGIDVEVTPSVLEFNSVVTRSFNIKFTATHKIIQGTYMFGSLTWVDGVHSVRIPIAVKTVTSQDFYADIL